MSNEENVTIILLIRGRPEFTERWLKYANSNFNKLNIIVADGSHEKDKFTINYSKYPNLNLSSHDYVWDKNIKIYQEKILHALDLVKSKYVIFTSNDDFSFYDGIKKMETFLNLNKDFSAVMGKVFDFSVNTLSSNKLYGDLYSLNMLFKEKNFSDDDYYDRLVSYAANPYGLWHSLCKVNVMKEAVRLSYNNKLFEHQLFENFVSFFIVATGKVYFDKSLYMLHQVHSDMQTNSNNFLNIEDVVELYPKETQNFLNILTNVISKKYSLNNKIASNIINEIFIDKYIGNRKKTLNKKTGLRDILIRLISTNRILLFILVKIKILLTHSNYKDQQDISKIKLFLKNGNAY